MRKFCLSCVCALVLAFTGCGDSDDGSGGTGGLGGAGGSGGVAGSGGAGGGGTSIEAACMASCEAGCTDLPGDCASACVEAVAGCEEEFIAYAECTVPRACAPCLDESEGLANCLAAP